MSQTNVLSALGVGARNVSSILSANGKWRIDESGKLVVKSIETQELRIKNQELSKTGITIYDQDTGEVYCAGIKSGKWVKVKGECGSIAPPALEPDTADSIP